MIDAISIYTEIESPRFVKVKTISPTIWRDIMFSPEFNSNGEVIAYQGEFNNLRLRIKDCKLFIRNSLHRYMKGNNYSDFTYDELCIAIDNIAAVFNISVSDFKIGKLEFGLNIEMPSLIIDQLISYKKKPPIAMKKGGNIYGKKIELTEFSIKIYDKTKEQRLHYPLNRKIGTEILRVEIAYNKKRSIKFIDNLSHLRCRERLSRLFNHFIKIVSSIEFAPEPNFLINLTGLQRKIYFAGTNPDFWKIEKLASSNSEKKTRAMFNKIIKASSQYNKLHIDFLENLKSKFEELLN